MPEPAYAEAKTLWHELGDEIHTTQAQVGLASVLLARGGQVDLDQALAQVENIASELLREPPCDQSGMISLWIYLVCAKVLQAKQDPRTRPLIAKAAAELQARAVRITDPATRFSYLENVPEHRATQHLRVALVGTGQL